MTGFNTSIVLRSNRFNQQTPNTRHINSQNTIPQSLIPVPQGTQPYPTYSSFTGASTPCTSLNFRSTSVDSMAPVNRFYA